MSAMTSIVLKDLLEIENTPEVLDICCPDTGIVLWPGIRNQFFRLIMSDYLFTRPLINQRQGVAFRSAVSKAVVSSSRALIHNFVRSARHQQKIMITTGSSGLFLRGGRWFNRLTDHFASVYPGETLIMEDLFQWQWRSPRHHDHIHYHLPFFLKGYLFGKILVRDRHRTQARVLVDMVRTRARGLLGWELGERRAAFLTHLLSRHCASIPVMRETYAGLLRKMGARILIREMGCYGRSSILNATAKDLGLVVAEHQHGVVSAGHDAYNVAPALANSAEYRRVLPSYFLSYGKWWGDQLGVPVQAITVGNPHRDSQLHSLTGSQTERRDILVLGDGVETAAYLEFSTKLAKIVGSRWRVVFRPHPIEREKLRTIEIRAGSGVHIDSNPDIYASFCHAHAVVSEASTGLFEAVGVAGMVVARKTQRGSFSLPVHPFESASDPEELAEKVMNPSAATGDALAENIWATGWRCRYQGFIQQHLS